MLECLCVLWQEPTLLALGGLMQRGQHPGSPGKRAGPGRWRSERGPQPCPSQQPPGSNRAPGGTGSRDEGLGALRAFLEGPWLPSHRGPATASTTHYCPWAAPPRPTSLQPPPLCIAEPPSTRRPRPGLCPHGYPAAPLLLPCIPAPPESLTGLLQPVCPLEGYQRKQRPLHHI